MCDKIEAKDLYIKTSQLCSMLPQELEVWYVIPSIRAEFARYMLKEGLKQNEIANKLGLRESTVSQYVKKKRGEGIKFPESIKKEIKKSVKLIINNKKDSLVEIQRICKLTKKQMVLCKLHYSLGFKDKQCEVCLK